MNSGYYAACAGLKAQTQALDLVAHNLANVNTTGYRAELATFRSLLASARGAVPGALNYALNDFGVLGGSHLDFAPGSLTSTGNPLDLGLEGAGFFVAQTAHGNMYTRNGNFSVSAKGQLVTSAGDPVLGENGPISVPNGVLSMSPDGTLSVSGAVAGKLQVVDFPAGAGLVPAGNSYYSAPEGAAQKPKDISVRQGTLESSNVNPVTSVVDLITVQRHAEMLQRALNTFYSDFNHIAASELPRV